MERPAMTTPAPSAAASPPPARGAGALVAGNTAILMLAQVLATPLSMVMNMVVAQKLGPLIFGQFYLATTAVGFGFLFVDWGLGAVVPAQVARDRSRAGLILGSALAWRLVAAPLAALILMGGFFFMGKSWDFQLSLALFFLGQMIGLVGRTCGDVVRGFERADIGAYSYVGGQFLTTVVIIPVLLLGGGLHAMLIAGAFVALVMVVPLWRVLKPTGVGPMSIQPSAIKSLLHDGTSFFFFGLILQLQPLIDALFLSWYSGEEVIGWFAAARKLTGVLITPAAALIGALYPTLCRLFAQDGDEFRATSRGAFRAALAMTVPLAIGCFMYPDLGIRLFSKVSFAPAQANLQVVAAYIPLVYVTMVMGTCLSAAGRQRAWTGVQFLCIVVSAIADPLLVKYCQQRYGNGGLGICATMVVSEVLMLAGGFWLMPRGVMDRTVTRSALLVGLAGAAMVGAARLLSGITSFVAAPVAVLAYLGALYAVGGIDKSHVQMLRSFVARKVARR
jgi:O-antigen/teichoic acid export membrane protein